MAIETTYKNAMDTMAVNFSAIAEIVYVFSDLVIVSKMKISFRLSGVG